MDAVRRLANFITTHPKGMADPNHLDRAADAVLDTLGCMLLGRDAPVTHAALSACRDWGTGPVHVPGTGATLPAPWAALVGGAAAHAFDLDDYTLVANDHPSAVMVPALLAKAATHPKPLVGTDLLDAYLIGLEVIFRAGAALNMEHYNRGWHTTSTLDSLGATAAVARLSGLSAKHTAAALSLTTSLGSGFVSQFGTMAKPLHAGISAKAGLLSCALAEGGATASSSVLDGPVSLEATMTPDGANGFAVALDGLGETWGLDRFGLGAKFYPSCGYTHRTIDAAIALHHRLNGLSPDEISAVRISLPDFHLAILPYGVPETTDEALFSAPWCTSVALTHGTCRSAHFTPDAIADPGMRTLAAKVQVSARTPKNPAINLDPSDPDTVSLSLADGRHLRAEVDIWTGAPGRDLEHSGLLEKYRDIVADAGICPTRSNRLADRVLSLPQGGPIRGLLLALADLQTAAPPSG